MNHSKFNLFATLFLFFSICFGAQVSAVSAAPAKIDPTFYPVITNGDFAVVNASAVQSDGKVIVAGAFAAANGFGQSAITRLLANGQTDQSFGPVGASTGSVAGIIYDLGIQPDGKIVVGGNFVNVGGQSRRGIARLSADGVIDAGFSFNFFDINPAVNSIVIEPDGKILIGGAFLAFRNLVRLNADGTLDGTFTNNLPTGAGEVTSILRQPDGKFVVAYRIFESSNWRTRTIRLDANGGVDASFASLEVLGTGAISGGSPDIDAMALEANGQVLIGGSLSSVGGQARGRVARLNADGTLDAAFQPNFNGAVFTLSLLPDGKFLAGGIFSQVNGTARNCFARLNADGTLDAALASPFTDATTTVNTISRQPDGKIIAGGQFLNVGGALRYRVARLDPDGALDASFAFVQIGASALTVPIALRYDGKIFVAGDFVNINGQERRKLALINRDGTLDESFQNINFGSNFYVNDLLPQPDGKILVGGTFTFFAGDKIYDGFVRFNQNGTLDTTFADRTAGASNVGGMALQPDGKILIGGSFTTIGGAARNRLARLNADGTLDATFLNNLSGANSYVTALTRQPDGKILIGGAFTQINNAGRNGLARLNADGTLDTTFLNNLAGLANSFNSINVNKIELQPDGKILVNGNFDTVNGAARKYFVRLNSDGSVDSTFLNGLAGTNTEFQDFALLPNGKILIAGGFTTVNGQNRRGYAQLNADGSLDASFELNFGSVSGALYAVAVESNGNVIAGGLFRMVNNLPRAGLFRIIKPETRVDFDGDGRSDISIFRPAVGEWWYARSSDGQVPAAQFGASTDKPLPADYTGDGRADIAFWRPSSGEWFILRSENGSFLSFPFGTAGDVPTVGDFDGDGRADPAVFRPSNSTWYVLKSTGGTQIRTFGASGDLPVAADYDGDGKTDIAIYRPAAGEWWIERSANNSVYAFRFGTPADKAVPGDYTGDGRADAAFWRPSTGEWFILRSEDSSFYSVPFGAAGDLPIPGDYDGDGRFDTAVFRPSSNTWFVDRSTAGILITDFGAGGDKPLANVFVP